MGRSESGEKEKEGIPSRGNRNEQMPWGREAGRTGELGWLRLALPAPPCAALTFLPPFVPCAPGTGRGDSDSHGCAFPCPVSPVRQQFRLSILQHPPFHRFSSTLLRARRCSRLWEAADERNSSELCLQGARIREMRKLRPKE